MWPLCLVAFFISYGETEHPRSELSLQYTALVPVSPVPQDHSNTIILLFSFRHQFPGEGPKAGMSMTDPVKSPHIQQRNLIHGNAVSEHSLAVVWYSVSCKAHLWVQSKVCSLRHKEGSVALQLDRPLLIPADPRLVNLQIIINTAKAGHILTWTQRHFSPSKDAYKCYMLLPVMFEVWNLGTSPYSYTIHSGAGLLLEE